MQAFEDAGVRQSYYSGHLFENAAKNLKRKSKFSSDAIELLIKVVNRHVSSQELNGRGPPHYGSQPEHHEMSRDPPEDSRGNSEYRRTRSYPAKHYQTSREGHQRMGKSSDCMGQGSRAWQDPHAHWFRQSSPSAACHGSCVGDVRVICFEDSEV